ncbi:hypothetical protein [Mycoplasma seminis]|uniref:DNA polymerase III subunit delta n=1 Tax=Mycoplasma seminis TaxID=512749 RepID=A0ABY9HAU2_9MOLU|nr:hypothetical protein [Mycoplasma seminis]WLP85718.1 hypothetical protein Q8852_01000 [Mycoplasma seminis]
MLTSKILNNINDLALKGKLNHLFLLYSDKNYNFDSDLINLINAINNTSDVVTLENLTPNVVLISGEVDKLTKEDFENAFYHFSFKSVTQNVFKHDILIIKNIENASINALNAILKSIEDPSDNLIIILTSNNLNIVLDTIISRAQLIRVQPKSQVEILSELPNDIANSTNGKILAYLFKEPSQIVDNFDEFSNLIQMLKNAIKSSFTNAVGLFDFLDANLNKENSTSNELILNFIKELLLGRFSQDIGLNESETQEIKQLREDWIKCCPRIFNLILDINDFEEKLLRQGIFELHKEILLIKLMEYYG